MRIVQTWGRRSARRGASLLLLAWVGIITASPVAAVEPAPLAETFDRQVKPFLSTYCLDCHNQKQQKGDLDLAQYLAGRSALSLSTMTVWKEAAGRVHANDMPPAAKDGKELKQPSEAERAQFVAWVRDTKFLAPKDPGRGTIRRLSQVEYANTLRDLLGADPQVASQVPRDTIGEGFTSSLSPLLMEKYLVVADEILDQAIKPEQVQVAWQAGELTLSIAGKEEPGKPAGGARTINGPGELLTSFSASVDGSYTIRVRAATEQVLGGEPLRLAVRIDNQVVGELKITASPKNPKLHTLTAKLSAGRTKLSLLVLNPYVETRPNDPKQRAPQPPPPRPVTDAPKGKDAKPETAPPPPRQDLRVAIIENIEVTGPPAAKPSDLQRRLLIAMPGPGRSKRDAAMTIAESFARRAYRRPPTAGEISGLLKVFDLADQQDEPFTASIKLMLKAVLISPAFIYLTPDDGAVSGKDGDIVPLGDHQVAAKLSYLFWSTMPDDELSALADAGKLRDPAVIAEQVRRLIKDPRSRALFDGFGASWLGIDALESIALDQKQFPEWNKDLRSAMYQEAAMLFDTILRDDRSMSEFVDNDYTFMNPALGRLYGMEDRVKGAAMTRVTLNDGNRGGILTMPGVLLVTSLPTRTSPVKRGAWVLERVLGQKPPPPPANVPELAQQGDSLALNLRQRTERHRADPACFGCHQAMDPIGFGLENFDVLGRWRERDDTGAPVDAVGELPGKQRFTTPGELKRLVSSKKDDLCRALVQRALAYALCRTLSGYDEVVADQIADAVAKDGYRFQSVWVRIATSYPFLNRRISR